METKKKTNKTNIKDKDLDQIKEKVKKNLTLIKKKSKSAEKKIKEYIDKNPEKSILIATGLGAAVGAIIGLGLRKRK